jgi:hypothetical protein
MLDRVRRAQGRGQQAAGEQDGGDNLGTFHGGWFAGMLGVRCGREGGELPGREPEPGS